jgi:hypothetical protein
VKRAGTPNGTRGGRESEERALRLKALRQKKERLGYAAERLTLQSQQRQRQLRMSVAATRGYSWEGLWVRVWGEKGAALGGTDGDAWVGGIRGYMNVCLFWFFYAHAMQCVH